ncbi:MAG: hypothetical protein K6U80_08115 [Firmicutes bacterium]|nr:hypothetical protein [Bacillota bacterium]
MRKCDGLDVMIGQMLFFGFSGSETGRDFSQRYQQIPSGGVILFRRNLQNPEQIKKLTENLQELAQVFDPDRPLLIAVDQENGNLSPLRGLIPSLPGNMGLAATGDPHAAYWAGYITGKELINLGINLNLAPVLDLAAQYNPAVGPRAFGDQPELVARYGVELARGLRAGGALFMGKHCPGHGNCNEDSHYLLPICRQKRAVLIARDLAPFRAVAAVNGASLMMAHVKYPDWDQANPASLSAEIIGFLRRELNFQGVIMTDCLEMDAIQQQVPLPAAAVAAVQAGNDLILISHSPQHQTAAFQAIREAVKEGRIKIRRIEESVARIRKWKDLLGKGFKKSEAEIAPEIGRWSPGQLALKTITLHAPHKAWPFSRAPLSLITPELHQITPSENLEGVELFEGEIRSRGITCRRIECRQNPSDEEISRFISENRCLLGDDRVAFLLSNPVNSSGQIKLIQRLAKTNPVLLISIRDPREVMLLGMDLPAVFTYCAEPPVLKALAAVLAGDVVPEGKLPILKA